MKAIARLLALVGCTLLTAQPALPAQSPPPGAPSSDYAQEAYVIEQSRTAWRFENDGSGRRESFLRVRVQSEAGVQMWGQMAFPYSSLNERMNVVAVRVLKADGTIVTATASAVQDLSSAIQREAPVYTDTREKHITVPGLRPGEILEVALRIDVHTPLAPGHFWGDHDFSRSGIVLDERLQIDVPANRKVTLKTRSGFDPVITEHDGRRLYDWQTSRRVAESDKSERGTGKRSAKPERPAVRLTTFGSWEELGRWYHELEQPQRSPGAEIRKKAIELTAGRATAIAKLEALYEYVATNFRYVSLSFGVGRYQPHAAAEVLHNGYGDCKDKHTLLASLAESIGLTASAALINSATELDPEFPSPSQFDHVITRVTVGTEQVWLDATAEVAPFRLLSPALRMKQALVVAADGAASVAQTPATTPMKNFTNVDIDSRLTDSGTLSANVHLTFSGDFELMMRTVFRRTPLAQWEGIVEAMSDPSGRDGEISDWTVSDPVALRETFAIRYRLTEANFVTWNKKRFDLELPLAEWISAAASDASDDNSESSIELGPERETRYRIQIALPDSYTGQVPLRIAVDRDYAAYRADYTLDGHVFVAERTLAFRQRELAGSRRSDYAAFRRAVSGDLRQTLALESHATASVGVPAQLTAQELYSSGTDAVNGSKFDQAATLLKRAVELEPTHRGAWTNLGRAYMGLHRTDAAIDAFQKQIGINPYDQYAYNNLGFAYRTQQKFAEAEAAFLKQLEIDPLNTFAHENLGGIYLEQRQYERAAPELEKAIALSPKNGILRVRLGEALLNLDNAAGARAAFNRAVELDPSPRTWNDIAYQLALNRTDLDVAQRYAESAVAATTAASRTASVERVTARDLWNTASMGSHWDTLGWVHFAKGDVDRAQHLVRASWVLLQNAEVADHLGQIYEKLGKREEAIRAYALSMSAERPDPRTRDRLAALVGDADRVDAVMRQHAQTLVHDRTVPLDTKSSTTATADFFVLLDNSSGASRGPRVEDVAFISGDESLKPFADTLRRTNFGVVFPDPAPAKVLRRGTVSCPPAPGASPCRFIMMLPPDAQAAQPE